MQVELDEITIIQCKFFQCLREERCLVEMNDLRDCSFFNGKVTFAYECGLLTEGHMHELLIRTLD